MLSTLANWVANAWWMTRYAFVVFYAEEHVSSDDLATITFVPFNYDAAWQDSAYTGGGGGGPWINWMLAHEMFFNVPELMPFDYFMRMDDDITFFAPSTSDPFLELYLSGARVGWKQDIADNDDALASNLFERTNTFSTTFPTLSDVWPLVSIEANRGPNKISNWRPYLVAGCVEIYAVSVFRTPAYQMYLAAVGAADGLRKRSYWEQEVKTMWMQLSVNASEWRCVACLLPLSHKGRHLDDTWFVSSECDFERGILKTRGDVCTLDPDFRFC